MDRTKNIPNNSKPVVRDPSFVDLLAGGISLAAILKGFPTYASTFSAILKRRRQFLHHRRSERAAIWKDGLVFLIYGIFISFILLVPTMMVSESTTGKWSYLFRLLILYSYAAALLHLACIAGKGSGTIGQTIGCYSYMTGLWVPIHILSVYPMLLALGPEIMFGKHQDEMMKIIQSGSLRVWVFYTLQLFAVIIDIIVLVFFFYWLSYVHKISVKRVFWWSIALGVPGMAMYLFLLAPLVNTVGDLLEQALSYL